MSRQVITFYVSLRYVTDDQPTNQADNWQRVKISVAATESLWRQSSECTGSVGKFYAGNFQWSLLMWEAFVQGSITLHR